jgi:hypothetical protein
MHSITWHCVLLGSAEQEIVVARASMDIPTEIDSALVVQPAAILGQQKEMVCIVQMMVIEATPLYA